MLVVVLAVQLRLTLVVNIFLVNLNKKWNGSTAGRVDIWY